MKIFLGKLPGDHQCVALREQIPEGIVLLQVATITRNAWRPSGTSPFVTQTFAAEGLRSFRQMLIDDRSQNVTLGPLC